MVTQAQTVDEYIAEQKKKLDDNPECAQTNYNLGMGYLTKRMFKEAEDSFLKAIDCSDRMVEAYVQLGGIALQRGDVESCLRFNHMALKQDPKFAIPWANIGYVHLQRGEAAEAAEAFRKALKFDPKFVQALANLSAAQYMMGQLDESEASAKKALKIAPEFGPALNNMALVALERKDYGKAKEFVEKARATGFEPPAKLVEEIEKQG